MIESFLLSGVGELGVEGRNGGVEGLVGRSVSWVIGEVRNGRGYRAPGCVPFLRAVRAVRQTRAPRRGRTQV